MKYLYILNPAAGRKKNARELIDAIDERMSISGHDYEFAYTTAAGDATRITREAVDEHFDIIVAVGGDGTVNEVASGLIRKKSALGILPLGSGNGIARSLNIPLEFETTIDLLLSPPILTIDGGKLNGKNFIGIAGTGYDALVGKKFQTFGIRGPLPYFFISVKEFISYRYQNYSITIDNEPLQIKALMVTFANTREYGNGAVIAPNADPADGFLDICFMKPLTLPGAIAVAPMLFNNKIDTHPGFVSKKCRSVTVRAGGEDMFVHRDGEPDESTRALEVGIEEKALRVCTPLGAKI